ncbi:MAG: TIR domain-containing protein [Deltaproteobacteria bacterium]|nr:TIR domain-containing protein [Deltaproteobacteria bacterium]MBI3388676.1 TIR domain-containing protein [Deltaproteobacteria bacterium]
MSTDADTPRRFDVALSFPGEHREFVKQVAGHLAAQFTTDRVLYDKYHQAEFAAPDLDVYLPNLYRTQSELIVLFLCPEYAAKRWCRLEWRFIRQMLATVEARRIMFLSFGNPGDVTELGILSGDGYIDIDTSNAKEIAEEILKRLSLNQGITPPRKPPDSTPTPASRFDISRIIKYAPAELIGREAETKLLSDAWAKVRNAAAPRPHVLTFVALGGEGKTSLVAKWAAELAGQDWSGCDAVFAWSFYSQGTREQAAASSDVFLKEALTFFGDAAMAGSAQGAFDKGRRLAQLVGERRALLILDGLEPLQYAPTSPTPGELKDQGLAALLKGLAATSHGLCVVTTRYSIPDLRAYWQTTAPEVKLTRLSKDAGVALLKRLGVTGNQKEFAALVEDVQGHALTLNLLGAYLHDAHAGDIRKRDLVKFEEADAEEQGGHAFRVMDAYVLSYESEGEKGKRALALLRLLGLFDRPATADCLAALLKAPAVPGLTGALVRISEAQRNVALTRLETAKLLTVNRDAAGTLVSLDAHPLLREYFARQLRTRQPEAWRGSHRRLYEHLCASTKEGDQPTLEDLQPLYQSVAHGCQAGWQQEACDKVFFSRIQRGNEIYSVRKLGALGSNLGAIACFFETPWSRVSPALTEADQAWLLNAAAFTLRALGRLTEALDPMRAATEWAAKKKDWEHAAAGASNLSELELTLGEVAGAVGDAEQSVTYADRSGDAGMWNIVRTTHADALHQAGRRAEAEARFREAEQMQAESQPGYPLLYSVQGFQYCDLLLTEAERAAWELLLNSKSEVRNPKLVEACRAVEQRAAQTLKWEEGMRGAPILDFALHHLTLGRAALYAVILEKSEIQNPKSEIDQAVAGLRRAGTQHMIPLGLLTRAWLRLLTGARIGPESAQSDLDEAWDIAERGPMRLFMADIHLHRARLFGMRNADSGMRNEGAAYPWESPQADLAAAEKLINACGYHGRDEELADAKKAILGS